MCIWWLWGDIYSSFPQAARRRPTLFVWCIQCSHLASYALSFHSETTQQSSTQHSSSAFDLPLQCALCRDRRGIYTEQACGSGSAEDQHSLIGFPLNHSTFPPSRLLPLLLSCVTGWERCTMNAPACMSVSIQLLTDAGFSHNILYMVFNITSGRFEESEGARRGVGSVEMEVNDTLRVDRSRWWGQRWRESWKRRGGDRRFGD